jgi:serine/threonine-protein kinase
MASDDKPLRDRSVVDGRKGLGDDHRLSGVGSPDGPRSASDFAMSDLDALAQARVGTTLRGKYHLERLLGVGGMAAVYRASHRVGTRVALKVLHAHMSINSDVRARFLREGYVANRVEHKGAVRVLDDDTAEDGSVFLAMELLEGETLEARWKRCGERMPVRDVAEFTHQLLDVLAAAHDKGIVHRDIKPENLFVTDGGMLKVLDFGIARMASTLAPQGATRTGRMMGSPAFMAPEQALGLQREISGQTDLWSTGATMFALLSGRFVHEAETVESMLIYAGSRPAPSVHIAAPEVPAVMAAVVDRALAFAKAHRWGSAREMQAALEAAYVEMFGVAMPGARTVMRASKPVLQLQPTMEEPRASEPIRSSVSPTVDGTQYQQPLTVPPMARTTPAPSVAPTFLQGPVVRGVSTTAGLVRSGLGRVSELPKTRNVGLLLGGIGGVTVLAIAGFALFVARGNPASPPAAASTAIVGPVVTVPAVGPTVVLAPPSTSASAPPEVSIEQLPSATPLRATPPAPVGPTSVPRPAAAAAAVGPTAATPTATPRPHSSCSPPYTIDAAGHRVPKPECL